MLNFFEMNMQGIRDPFSFRCVKAAPIPNFEESTTRKNRLEKSGDDKIGCLIKHDFSLSNAS